jgi:hypothetical protein
LGTIVNGWPAPARYRSHVFLRMLFSELSMDFVDPLAGVSSILGGKYLGRRV